MLSDIAFATRAAVWASGSPRMLMIAISDGGVSSSFSFLAVFSTASAEPTSVIHMTATKT